MSKPYSASISCSAMSFGCSAPTPSARSTAGKRGTAHDTGEGGYSLITARTRDIIWARLAISAAAMITALLSGEEKNAANDQVDADSSARRGLATAAYRPRQGQSGNSRDPRRTGRDCNHREPFGISTPRAMRFTVMRRLSGGKPRA